MTPISFFFFFLFPFPASVFPLIYFKAVETEMAADTTLLVYLVAEIITFSAQWKQVNPTLWCHPPPTHTHRIVHILYIESFGCLQHIITCPHHKDTKTCSVTDTNRLLILHPITCFLKKKNLLLYEKAALRYKEWTLICPLCSSSEK